MKKKELNSHIKSILLGLGLVGFFTLALLSNVLLGGITWSFYPSFLTGMAFGLAFCLHLSNIWDPSRLALKKDTTNASKKGNAWYWGAPLGVLAGNIASQYMGDNIRNIGMGIFYGWFYIVMIYLTVQVWRYRPK